MEIAEHSFLQKEGCCTSAMNYVSSILTAEELIVRLNRGG